MPIVYILTHKRMPDLVKIGHTGGELKDRMNVLKTGLPGPFECYYAVEVPDARAIEKKLHDGLVKCRVEGKPKREFFEIDPEEAKALLGIAEVMGGVDVTPPKDTQDLQEEAYSRRSKFRFGMLGIEPGERLQFKNDNTIECEVVDDSQVRFRDEVMSLSKSASIILKEMEDDLGWNVAGTLYWCWHGQTLYDLRLQKEQDQ